MDDQFLVEVPELPPPGPLLFFVRNRPGRIINAILILIGLMVPLAVFSLNLHNLATPRISWGFIVAAALIAVLAYCVVVLAVSRFHLLKPGPPLVLYEEGIYDRRLSEQIISWNEISRISRSESSPCLYSFHVSDPGGRRRTLRLIHRLPSLMGQLLGRGTFAVDFAGLEGELEPALRFMVYYIEARDSEKSESAENEPLESPNDAAMP